MSRNGNVERLAAAQATGGRLESPATLSALSWPELGEAAFYGLAGRFVRKIEPRSEADPAGILLQFLVLFGNMIGRAPHWTVEKDQHFTNLFAVLVGETSIGRKGVALNQAKRLLSDVDRDWSSGRHSCGLSSGEGLIYAVRDPIEKQEPDEDGSGMSMVTVDEGVTDKRLMVIETEFSAVLKVLKRDGNTLSSILRNAWDSGDLRTLTKNSPTKATGAHISIISHVTKAELLKRFDSIDASNGFGNRFLWCCVKRSKELPEGGAGEDLDFSTEIAELDRAAAFARGCGVLNRDSEANELWRSNYGALTQSRSGLFGSIITRAAPQVMRLACIYALLDQSAAIRRCHLEAGLTLWRYCENSARWIFGEAVGDSVADEILCFLRKNPTGVSRTQISKAFQGHQPRKTLDAVLEGLRTTGLVTCEKRSGAGRPTEVWRSTELPQVSSLRT